MSTDIQQLGRENSNGAVVGGESLVQLSHLPPDAGELFHQVDLEAHFRQVQGGLDPGDPAADY
jgi:hypothetical protein